MTVMALGAFAVFVWMAHHSIRESHPEFVRFSSPADGALALSARRLRSGEITPQEYARIAAILHM